MELMLAPGLIAQQVVPLSTADQKHITKTWLLAGKPSAQVPVPASNPFDQPGDADNVKTSDAAATEDALSFALDRKATTFWAADAYLPPTHTSVSPRSLYGTDWCNSIAGGASLYLTKSNTTAAQFMTDLESSGSSLANNTIDQSGGEDLTLKWGASHLFFLGRSQTHVLQFDAAGYQEWLVAPALLLGGPFADHLPAYTISSTGVEATFSLPSRNLVFSARYGTERLTQSGEHGHLIQFDLSWTW
jgi:hypothetical protein